METFVQSFGLWLNASKYILLFIACIVEGPVLMLSSGFLYRLGQFNFLPMYVALVLGDFTADILWYSIGRFSSRHLIYKYGKYAGITPRAIEKVETYFQEYHQKILIISKLTMGFGFAVVILVVAGIFKVPFKNYVLLNLIGGFIWTGLLLAFGYFFGHIYTSIPGSAKIVFVCALFITVIYTLRHIQNYMKKYITEKHI